MKKICVISGTRAEYGLLRSLISAIDNSNSLLLQLLVTGSHLSPEFGHTISEIYQDGFNIDRKVEILLSSDTSIGICKSMGLATIGFSDAFDDLSPDVIVILGDRFEMLSVASVAMIMRIPVLHIHGGEITMGAFDDSIRHSITKMSNIHCVAADSYRNRVIQLGEDPRLVHNVGGLGVDSINSTTFLSQSELEDFLDISLSRQTFLVTYHPATLSSRSNLDDVRELLLALNHYRDSNIIFTHPNQDTEGRQIRDLIGKFCLDHPFARLYSSLGHVRYLSCLRYSSLLIGNSSSGLLEAPSFKLPAVNIGSRQDGRLKAKSVIDCQPFCHDIINAIDYATSPSFLNSLLEFTSPYGSGGATSKILHILEKFDFTSIIRKEFHDLNFL